MGNDQKIRTGAGWLVASIAGAVIGAVIASVILQRTPGVGEAQIRQIVAEALPALTRPDDVEFGSAVESYLVANPDVLERATVALTKQKEIERRAAAKQVIESNRDILFDGKGAVEVGNPAGDVTVVELYDYNCGYCRSALPDVAALLNDDPNLRLVLRQFPILSQGSIDAAKVGTLVAAEGVDYWSFHQTMFTSRGQVTLETALAAASALGLDAASLRTRIASSEVDAALNETFDLASKLGVSGTPTFVLGDEIIPGAIGLEVLRQKIANVRKCGSTTCS